MLLGVYVCLAQSVKVMYIELKIEAMKAKTPVCMETVWFCSPEAAVKCIFRFSFKAFASSYKVGHSLGPDDPVMILWGWNNLEKVIRAEELRGTVAKKEVASQPRNWMVFGKWVCSIKMWKKVSRGGLSDGRKYFWPCKGFLRQQKRRRTLRHRSI